MQELIPIDRNLNVINVFRNLDAKANDEALTNTQEAVDDLSELQYLIAGASDIANGMDDENFKQRMQLLASQQRRQLDLVERANRWGSTTEVQSLLQAIRKYYIQTKLALRSAYRHRGAILCASDWQSPIYSSSIPLGFNRLQEGIAEHSWDYKRDGHFEALDFEESFVKEHLSHLQSDRLKAYLTNSGMAAFTTVLHWLAHERSVGKSVLALRPMYFENLHLAKAAFPHMVQLDSPGKVELAAYLHSEQPSIVFVDAITNCGDVLSHDLETIMRWARTQAVHELYLVIDTTCIPSAMLPAGLLKALPDNVSILLVESMAKHHQFGMDSVTGGIVAASMDQERQDSFRKTRARTGTNIADSSVGALPPPNRKQLIRRMQRHSRNTRMLAEGLESMLASHDGVVESVSWLSNGTPACPWFRGTCLTIRLSKHFRSIQTYKQFEHIALEMCKEQDLPIGLGTSFGFDVSRLYVTAPSTRFEEPFLRIAVGTETKEQIERLLEVLRQASIETKKLNAVPEQRAPKQVEEVQILPPVLKKEVENQAIQRSVFAGEEGLKNYLSPQNYAPTPLIELPSDLNPFKKDGVRIFAKMMPLVPLMNIKSIPAFSMLSKAAERGDLQGVSRVIESSSSNTVLSLSIMAKLFGIDTTCAIVDHSIAPALMKMLRLFGIEIFKHPGIGHELYEMIEPRSERAAKIGNTSGWMNPGQYTNPDNPDGFARWLAPQLWAQTQGRLSIFACALGTCGTMVGVSRGLREHDEDIQVVACCPQTGHNVPGPRERSQLKDVTFAWQDVANACMEMEAEESFAASVKLLRRGILGGPSSGMNYAGLLRYLQQEKEAGRLQELVQQQGEVHAAFLCCDSPLPHVEDYYRALGEEYFPAVHDVPRGSEPAFEVSPVKQQAAVAPKSIVRKHTYVPSVSLKLRKSRLARVEGKGTRVPRLKHPEREHV